jgi:hypothetical protein
VVIPLDVFQTLVRTGTISPDDFTGTATYTLADGSTTSSNSYVLHKMAVGNHVVSNVVANVAPVQADPLLGQSFLAKLLAWTIDNSRHALVLTEKAGPMEGELQTGIVVVQRPTTTVLPPGVSGPPVAGNDKYLAHLVTLMRQHLDLLSMSQVGSRRGETRKGNGAAAFVEGGELTLSSERAACH